MTTQVAFLFPGQGSQSVGMGADIYETSPAARRVFEDADRALGFSLSTLCFEGPEDVQRATINAQPAIVVVSLAYLAAFQEALAGDLAGDTNDAPNLTSTSWRTPCEPKYVAGHSVGELTALIASGALDFHDGVRLVRERGRLMEHEGTVCPGGMSAIIAMDDETLQSICTEATTQAHSETAQAGESDGQAVHPGLGTVVIANYNAPGQIVISGERRALEIASGLAKERGAKRVMPLAVSGAFHSPVMQPAADALTEVLRGVEVRDAMVPVIGNIHAEPLSDAEALRQEMARQVASAVQWVRSIEQLVKAGVDTFIEIGPGQALAGLVKRIAKDVTILNIGKAADIEKAVLLMREKSVH